MITAMTTTVVTASLEETRRFYERFFQAQATFDAGWYVALRLGSEASAPVLCLMKPQDGQPTCNGGVTLNLSVPDANITYATLVEEGGLEPLMPLEDHPWGDRGFCVADPSGVRLYCYHDIPPSEAFLESFKTPQER